MSYDPKFIQISEEISIVALRKAVMDAIERGIAYLRVFTINLYM